MWGCVLLLAGVPVYGMQRKTRSEAG